MFHNSLWVYLAFILGGLVGAGIVSVTVAYCVSSYFRAWILMWFWRR
jgi:hypothetical protein